MPLLSLGLFPFEVASAPYHSLSESFKQAWSSAQRVGGAIAYQHIGQAEQSITIAGCLYPGQLTGPASTLDRLKDMAATGKAWIMTSGTGRSLGRWVIEGVEQTETDFFANGTAIKIAFSITLKRCWDESPEALGRIADSDPQRATV